LKHFLFFLFLFSGGFATEFAPWFSIPFEFQGRASYFYDSTRFVQSPLGNFKAPSDDYSFQFSLGVTPWPYWNAEVELYMTHTSDVSFAYEAAICTVRYAWLDDIAGDPISLVTGATFAFPGKRFLFDFSFDYHAEVNGELHVCIGKEWAKKDDWWTRVWALGGYGIANRGNGWVHGLGTWEFKPLSNFDCGIFSEAVFGLGPNNIIPDEPFEGFASIAHQNVYVGCFFNVSLPCNATVGVISWYNVYARNFVENYWGGGISVLVPFSII